jgi:hypothetical protein
MRKYILIMVSIMTLSIAACGGGDSSSDSSTSGSRFTGVQTLTLLGESSQAAFVMTVSDSTVTINDADFTASGALDSNNNFSVTVPPFSITDSGITCTFNVVYTGTVSGSTSSGNISGSTSCLGSTFSITGTFAANSNNGKQLTTTFSKAIVDTVSENIK